MDSPPPTMRLCRSGSDVICVWICYPDIIEHFPTTTAWQRPRAPEPLPYYIVTIPGAGGLYAARNIARGETIIREMPLLITPAFMIGPNFNDKAAALADHEEIFAIALDHLESADKARFRELSNRKSKRLPVFGTIETNNLKCNFPQAKIQRYGAICPEIACANHRSEPFHGLSIHSTYS